MWYKDEQKPKSLYFADSPYLDNWEVKGAAVTDFSGEGPKVIRWNGSYWLIACSRWLFMWELGIFCTT